MAELKTAKTAADPSAFIAGVADEQRRKECIIVMEIMEKIAGAPPAMWGPSIVGFGNYHFKYESGREGKWFLTGFSPRKQALTLYIMAGFDRYDELLAKLGKFKTGKSCLYIKNLDDVHMPTLKALIKQSVAHMKRKRS
jgi:hypothetical protein